MKVCIISHDEYINIPYIKKYENILHNLKIEFDVILWDRYGLMLEDRENWFVLRNNLIKTKYKIKKVKKFIIWVHFVFNVLRKEKYDIVIVLTTLPAVLLNPLLLTKYKRKYIFDIRDFTYENIIIYKKIVDLLVERSLLTSISSEGFLRWLNPNHNLVLNHNLSNIDGLERESKVFKSEKIILGFVGGLRYTKINKIIINQFANKEKYILKYIGQAQIGCDLKEYVKLNEYKNVFFSDRFDNAKKPYIYKEIDIINAVYGNDSDEVLTALPNKLYDCIIYKRPIIVSSGTYLGFIVENYHLGFSIDVYKENIVEKLEQYLYSFNKLRFEKGCIELLELVKKQEEEWIKRIIAALQL